MFIEILLNNGTTDRNNKEQVPFGTMGNNGKRNNGTTRNRNVFHVSEQIEKKKPTDIKTYTNKGNNKITELRTILQMESQN